MTVVRLMVEGPIPGKKNLLRRSRNGGMFRDKKVSAQLDAITWQLKAQWMREPLIHPALEFVFRCKDLRSDLDNKLTTCLDCMQDAGILVKDNLKHLRGPITIYGELGPEGVDIMILETQCTN